MPLPGHTVPADVGVVSSGCPLPNMRTWCFRNKLADFDADWQKWSTGHEMINCTRDELGHKNPFWCDLSRTVRWVFNHTWQWHFTVRDQRVTTAVMQNAKVSVTWSRRQIWRPDRDIIVDPLKIAYDLSTGWLALVGHDSQCMCNIATYAVCFLVATRERCCQDFVIWSRRHKSIL